MTYVLSFLCPFYICAIGSPTVCVLFFFQAEDGILDIGVTGVQACALPICGTNCRLQVPVALTTASAVQSPSVVSTRKRSSWPCPLARLRAAVRSSLAELAAMHPAAVVGRTADGAHPDRPVHRQGEVPLVLGEVGGDRVGGRDVVLRRDRKSVGVGKGVDLGGRR